MKSSVLFGAVFGGVLGLALLKFGNPVILDKLIEPPADMWQWLFQPWPVRWGYGFLVICVILAIPSARFQVLRPKWFLLLPWLWLAWQFVAASGTVDPKLTRATLPHFTACVGCFLMGWSAMSQLRRPGVFWGGLLAGFVWVLWTGFEQRYGGLEATRQMIYEQPDWQQLPAEYLKRIQSNRIFASLVYPNALAAAILLLLPPLLLHTWQMTGRLTDASRAVIVGVLAYAAGACLVWSGSKSGWLIGLVLLLAVLLRLRFARKIKIGILALVLTLGLTAFFVKYAPYFRRGAPSVSARFEYWKAAKATVIDHPILGTGPGTFSVAYRQRKPPDAEMAQLVHNDYLEQASDSGLVGFFAYLTFVGGSIVLLPRFRPIFQRRELFVIWLGLLGWSLQSLVEFPLYIPALAWTAFALMGWLWGSLSDPSQIEKEDAAGARTG